MWIIEKNDCPSSEFVLPPMLPNMKKHSIAILLIVKEKTNSLYGSLDKKITFDFLVLYNC